MKTEIEDVKTLEAIKHWEDLADKTAKFSEFIALTGPDRNPYLPYDLESLNKEEDSYRSVARSLRLTLKTKQSEK